MRLMWKDEVVAEYKEGTLPLVMKAVEGVPAYKLPLGLFTDGEVTIEKFIEWASQRCFPPERFGADELLAEMGLDHYDGWEIVKQTKAKMPAQDDFSFELD